MILLLLVISHVLLDIMGIRQVEFVNSVTRIVIHVTVILHKTVYHVIIFQLLKIYIFFTLQIMVKYINIYS